ncbi:unnamed protein product [Symbiodinium sp. CCMP2592]|nr:unnamed protein product [Symbiodinium sp. CCMP2592]
MIVYDARQWTLLMILRVHGSVFPKGLCWALPNACIAAVLHWLLRRYTPDADGDGVPDAIQNMTGVEEIWSGYTFVLGFLVVFRNNQAYSRFWEGATLISQVRGEWFNAVSSLFAFTSRKPEKAEQVYAFRQLLIRLASMMYCAALQQVCDTDADDSLQILDTEGIAPGHLEFLEAANDQCEVLVQWVQQLIIESHDAGVVDVPPPILSRAFQELSRGIVTLNNARKIKDIPFPFPYAQMLVCMLVVHWLVTPMLASLVIQSWWWAAIMSFLVTGSFWTLMHIAMEIDQPFGADANDLPIKAMMKDYNRSLLSLLNSATQKSPTFALQKPTPAFVQSKDANLTFHIRKRLIRSSSEEDSEFHFRESERLRNSEAFPRLHTDSGSGTPRERTFSERMNAQEAQAPKGADAAEGQEPSDSKLSVAEESFSAQKPAESILSRGFIEMI